VRQDEINKLFKLPVYITDCCFVQVCGNFMLCIYWLSIWAVQHA